MILSACENLKKWQLLYIANSTINSLNQFREQFLNLYLIIKYTLHYDPSILLTSKQWGKFPVCTQGNVYKKVHFGLADNYTLRKKEIWRMLSLKAKISINRAVNKQTMLYLYGRSLAATEWSRATEVTGIHLKNIISKVKHIPKVYAWNTIYVNPWHTKTIYC